MTDIHALSGAYAIDAVDEVERARFERHLAECAACREEVASLREAAAQLPESTPVAPSADLRDRVLADIAQVRPLPPITHRRDRLTLPERARRRRTARFLAAAAAVVVIGGGVTVVHPWSRSTSEVDRVLQAGDAVSKTVDLRDGGSVTITRSRALDRAVMVTHDIAGPPQGRTYEVWLQDATGTMHPAGLMSTGGSRAVVLHGDASRATGAGITVEPAGGSERPTTAPVALVGFGRA